MRKQQNNENFKKTQKNRTNDRKFCQSFLKVLLRVCYRGKEENLRCDPLFFKIFLKKGS